MRKIAGFENYFVDKDGAIYSNYKKGGHGSVSKCLRRLKTSIGTSGYEIVHLYKDKKRSTIQVHRIVAETFILNTNSLPVVNHMDANKLNNNISNLEWVSYSGNYQHAKKLGLTRTRIGSGRLSAEQVLTIRTINNPKMDSYFSKIYNIDKSSICNIRNNKSYKWI